MHVYIYICTCTCINVCIHMLFCLLHRVHLCLAFFWAAPKSKTVQPSQYADHKHYPNKLTSKQPANSKPSIHILKAYVVPIAPRSHLLFELQRFLLRQELSLRLPRSLGCAAGARGGRDEGSAPGCELTFRVWGLGLGCSRAYRAF